MTQEETGGGNGRERRIEKMASIFEKRRGCYTLCLDYVYSFINLLPSKSRERERDREVVVVVVKGGEKKT